MLGIFITGPAGAIVGFIAGALFSQRHWCSNANHLTKRYSQPLADFIRHIQELLFRNVANCLDVDKTEGIASTVSSEGATPPLMTPRKEVGGGDISMTMQRAAGQFHTTYTSFAFITVWK